jgi:hypothetical protein
VQSRRQIAQKRRPSHSCRAKVITLFLENLAAAIPIGPIPSRILNESRQEIVLLTLVFFRVRLNSWPLLQRTALMAN